MQDVNPDMEDIFREAADKYPLQTDTADWKTVSQKIHANETEVRGGIAYSERKWIILFLLVLIPLGLTTTQYFKVQNTQVQTVAKVEDKQIKSSKADRIEDMIKRAEPVKQNIAKINKPLSRKD